MLQKKESEGNAYEENKKTIFEELDNQYWGAGKVYKVYDTAYGKKRSFLEEYVEKITARLNAVMNIIPFEIPRNKRMTDLSWFEERVEESLKIMFLGEGDDDYVERKIFNAFRVVIKSIEEIGAIDDKENYYQWFQQRLKDDISMMVKKIERADKEDGPYYNHGDQGKRKG